MKMRKIIALLLALCMLLSLSISAFAADDVVASGTIPDSKIKWALDSNGWLTISGSGEAPVFQSADDQPWAEYREQITEVWYDDTIVPAAQNSRAQAAMSLTVLSRSTWTQLKSVRALPAMQLVLLPKQKQRPQQLATPTMKTLTATVTKPSRKPVGT